MQLNRFIIGDEVLAIIQKCIASVEGLFFFAKLFAFVLHAVDLFSGVAVKRVNYLHQILQHTHVHTHTRHSPSSHPPTHTGRPLPPTRTGGETSIERSGSSPWLPWCWPVAQESYSVWLQNGQNEWNQQQQRAGE